MYIFTNISFQTTMLCLLLLTSSFRTILTNDIIFGMTSVLTYFSRKIRNPSQNTDRKNLTPILDTFIIHLGSSDNTEGCEFIKIKSKKLILHTTKTAFNFIYFENRVKTSSGIRQYSQVIARFTKTANVLIMD